MQFQFNGKTIDGSEPKLLTQILIDQGIDPKTSGIAVAVNQQIIQRSQWDSTLIDPCDRIEVVCAVQGG